jgi:VWFA-related protein
MALRRVMAGVVAAAVAACTVVAGLARPDGPPLGQAAGQAGAGRFHAATGGHLISVPVLVTDSRGRFMDVNPDAFELLEDKTPQRLLRVDHQELPLDVSLAVDISSSMEAAFPVVRTAANDFLSSVREPDLLRLLTFSDRITDVPRGRSWSTTLDDVMPRGATALRDAMIGAIGRQGTQPARRTLIVVSDGQTDKSRASIDTVREAIRITDIVLYLTVIAPDRNPRAVRDAWDQVTTGTGGRTVRPASRDLLATLKSVRAELPHYRVLTYRCPREAADGNEHAIEVQIRGRKDLRLRSRTAHIDLR